MTITYSNTYLKITGEPQEDGTLFETDIYMNRGAGGMRGDAFPSVSAWVADLDTETLRRAPWFRKHHKLSVEESSVVWVDSKQHYMEVRRGSQTTFAATGRRHWLSVDEWLQHCQPKAEVPAEIPVVEVAAAPVVVVSEVPAETPVIVAAFDAETFKMEFAGLKEWIQKQTDPHVYIASVIQTTIWLLEATVSADASAWLKKNPAWRYSVRAIFQAYGWNANMRKEGVDAVAVFLEKF